MRNLKDTIHAQRSRFFGHAYDNGEKVAFRAILKLHQIGEQRPYFSATVDGYTGHRNTEPPKHTQSWGGCSHEMILKYWKDAAVVVNLHLSDVDGVPMHAAGNGWYHAGGCDASPDFTPAFYLASGVRDAVRRNMPEHLEAAEAFLASLNMGPERVAKKYPANPKALAEHLRISPEEAERVCAEVVAGRMDEKAFTAYVYAMRPRWKDEADAALAFIKAGCQGDE